MRSASGLLSAMSIFKGEKIVEAWKTCWFCVMEFCFPLGTGRKPLSGPCSVFLRSDFTLRYGRDELFQPGPLLLMWRRKGLSTDL